MHQIIAQSAGLALAAVLGFTPALAQESAPASRPLVGIALPLSGAYGRIGVALRDGLLVSPLGTKADMTMADTECDDDAGRAAGREFVNADVDAIFGFVCADARAKAFALPGLDGVTALVPLSTQLTQVDPPAGLDMSGPQTIQFGPRPLDDADALGAYLAEVWRSVPFALIDDGTLQGRDFIARVRVILEEAQLEPVFTDVYRPQLDNQVALVRRLERAGATHVVLGGDRGDASVIAQDAARIGVPLTLAGGDNLRGPDPESPLPDGTFYGGLPDLTSVAGAADLAAALSLPVRRLSPFHVWGHAAGNLLERRLAGGPEALSAVDTLIGPLTFDADGNLQTNLMRVHEIVDGLAVPVSDAPAPT